MKDGVIRAGEFERFAKSITENNRDVKICLQKLTDHMINSDQRHIKADARAAAIEKTVEDMESDITKMLVIMDQRSSFFNTLSKLSRLKKIALKAVFLAIVTISVTGIYNYISKSETPEIRPIKTGAK